ncbi:transcription initiation protein [Nocardioides agariphilus]|uniref:Transcription initiation protein n=1 Tax=Nocardioides agariphilus TaxID=433664 RepID=A0A930VRQ3_9ACTN|nr:transcription initiation protein [Nocardioides agariphilus]
MVLLPGDEAAWQGASEEQRQATYHKHQEFAKLLEERGLRVTGGSELTYSREAKTLRTSSDGTQTVTDGPYSESVEQLTGFYLIEADSIDAVVDACKVLGEGESLIEVRACKGM